ncbi:MAG: hypothetical protein WDM96_13760 [Lacunisphaera sp.]
MDRGIGEFQRYGFHVRNGLAYFATPLQRLRVHRDTISARPSSLPAMVGCSVSSPRPKATPLPAPSAAPLPASKPPSSARAASAQDNNPDTAQELLIALGECERALSRASEKCVPTHS